MKILFVACYVDNPHFIDISKKTLDKYLLNCTYDFICLNDAPDIKNGEENFIKICDIFSENENCFDLIRDRADNNKFIHIKIPQNIHIKNCNNHSSSRHIENLNWFNENFKTLVKNYEEYDFLCHIDSDCIIRDEINLNIELNGYDMAGPFIYINPHLYYIHTGLFFINLKTVLNIKEINWNNTMGTDTGSDITNFILNNPQYKIKKLGHYNGYSENNQIINNHTIISLDILNINDDNYKLIDTWFDQKFVHFRAGSCFGVGTNIHRSNDRLKKYITKYNAFLKLLK
jgi:hypothetical protein